MLHNIFLFRGNKFQDLKDLNIYSYPNNIIKINDKLVVNKIIKEHDEEAHGKSLNSKHVIISKPVAQFIKNLNIYTACINHKIIIGLIFEEEDNPYDYKEIFEELMHELLNYQSGYPFEDEIEVENLLISLFIDIRRFGDEVIEKTPEIEYLIQRDSFYKTFLFGLDDVGKSSLVRRLKTGEFTDNYLLPTRKFHIEYLQENEKNRLFAFWDMPGQEIFRSKWLKGLQDSNIIIYMIDIANQRRFEESKKELWKVISNPELDGVPLLIIGNKIDLFNYSIDNSHTHLQNLKTEISKNFGFDEIRNRDWTFLFTSVKTNYNVDQIFSTINHLISS